MARSRSRSRSPPAGSSKDEAKKDKKAVKAEKEAKKAEKKAKKAAKKEKKHVKKEAKRSKKEAKKAKKKSSSSSSDSDSSLGLNFVMDKNFGQTGRDIDRMDPNIKIQKALGLNCGDFDFVGREDDEQVAKEVADEKLRQKMMDECITGGEDRSKDWICQKMKANGEMCGNRNFARNEKCFACSTLRSRHAPSMKSAKNMEGVKIDGHKRR
mmetsp:Transcript_83393/g.214760  ORF Transcript_83393/g.214760 Transcript_83393/m.214760 type:complete len:211 (-) Transcript_83393:74-706(-)